MQTLTYCHTYVNIIHMQLVRTTLRIEKRIKKEAERLALEQDTTLQDIVNRAIREYTKNKARKKAKKIVFETADLGVPLDNLTRDDFYDPPKIR